MNLIWHLTFVTRQGPVRECPDVARKFLAPSASSVLLVPADPQIRARTSMSAVGIRGRSHCLRYSQRVNGASKIVSATGAANASAI